MLASGKSCIRTSEKVVPLVTQILRLAQLPEVSSFSAQVTNLIVYKRADRMMGKAMHALVSFAFYT